MWLNCFLLGGIRKIWLGLRCDNDNVIKSAIIMSIAWRLHCSKSLTFLAELYTCTKRSIWYVRLLLQSWKKFEMTEFLNFYATKTHNQIFYFMRHLKTWKTNSQAVISGYVLSGSADGKISRGHGGRHFITTFSMITMSSYRVV